VQAWAWRSPVSGPADSPLPGAWAELPSAAGEPADLVHSGPGTAVKPMPAGVTDQPGWGRDCLALSFSSAAHAARRRWCSRNSRRRPHAPPACPLRARTSASSPAPCGLCWGCDPAIHFRAGASRVILATANLASVAYEGVAAAWRACTRCLLFGKRRDRPSDGWGVGWWAGGEDLAEAEGARSGPPSEWSNVVAEAQQSWPARGLGFKLRQQDTS